MADKQKEPSLSFASKTEAEIAANEFQVLLATPAWQRLVIFLDQKIAYFQNELRSGKIENMDALYRLRDKINLTEQFRNTPEIVQTMISMAEGMPIDLDPYSKPSDEVVDKASK